MKTSLEKEFKITVKLSAEEAEWLKSMCNQPKYFPEPDNIKTWRHGLFDSLKKQINLIKELETLSND